MPDLKIALLGCGRIAQMAHLPALARMKGAAVIGIADSDADHLKKAARHVPGARMFHDYRELLRDADADAVIITLPSHLHAPAAVAAFESGRHVYVEKPIAIDETSGRQVLDAEQRSGKIGMMGFNFRFHPGLRAMQRELQAGRIGRIVGVRGVFCSAPRPLPAWKRTRATGGSALLDLASHHIDLVHFLFGQDIAHVRAGIRSMRNEADTATLELGLADGTPVQLFTSINAAEQDRIDVIGEDGMLSFDRYGGRNGPLYQPSKRQHNRSYRLLSAIAVVQAVPRQLRVALRPPGEMTYQSALLAFVNAAANGGTSPIRMSEGFRSLAVVLSAEESAKCQV